MKKIVSSLLIFTMLFSLITVLPVSAKEFSDLNGHWGLEYINTLVNDGTINGYEDGTFRPNNTVSRAEFVKMIGKGSEKSNIEYIDVPADHWGYEYIMYSGLEVKGSAFLPNKAITRGEVLNLIWKRAGSKTGVIAPAIITNQGKNKDAIAWGYTYGIMSGDDGLNLRLDDTLTRAEGAALIVRSRQINDATPKKNFVDTVSEDILKAAFNSQILFDKEYTPDATFTNGEMAKASLRFGARQYNLTYGNITAKNELGCDYGKDFYVARNETLGGVPNTVEFVNANAKTGDTLSQLCYNLIKLVTSTASFKADKSYDDLKFTSDAQKKYLDYAAANGIYLYADNIINPEKEITMKEFAALLIQLDACLGTQVSYNSKGQGTNENLNLSVATYPENFEDYTAIIKSIPTYIYANKISDAKAKDMYTFATVMKSMFLNPLKEMETAFEKNNAKVDFTFYPALVTNPDSYFVYRVKMTVNEATNVSLKSLCDDKLECDDVILNTGDEIYMDLKILLPLGDLVLFYKDAKIVNIIK
ncbi:MAG: S-layer homology domain-containing protein [Ruminococcaceae bacterium]|nr:S-layer homology domain-containing protein [Oscillospiraceae bacterium]